MALSQESVCGDWANNVLDSLFGPRIVECICVWSFGWQVTESMTERCVCCSEGRLLGKPIRVMSRATLANALDGGSVTALPM